MWTQLRDKAYLGNVSNLYFLWGDDSTALGIIMGQCLLFLKEGAVVAYDLWDQIYTKKTELFRGLLVLLCEIWYNNIMKGVHDRRQGTSKGPLCTVPDQTLQKWKCMTEDRSLQARGRFFLLLVADFG